MTLAQRAEVVRRYEAGETSREVAEAMELGKATVLSILKRAGVTLGREACAISTGPVSF